MASVTTTTTTTSAPMLGISIDRQYIHTFFGNLNLLILVINTVCFICAASTPHSAYIPPQGWFDFVCVSGFVSCLLELLLGLFRIQDRMTRVITWRLSGMIFYGLWTFFYLTAAIAVTCYAANYQDSFWIAGAFFGFAASTVYGAVTFFRLIQHLLMIEFSCCFY